MTGFGADKVLSKNQLLGSVAPYIAVYESKFELHLFLIKHILFNLEKEYE